MSGGNQQLLNRPLAVRTCARHAAWHADMLWWNVALRFCGLVAMPPPLLMHAPWLATAESVELGKAPVARASTDADEPPPTFSR